MKTSQNKAYEDFFELGKDVLRHPVFLNQKAYYHHQSTTLFDHSVIVAFMAFKTASKFGLDVKSVVRGALLHDFFLYDWHVEGKRIKKPLLKKHGFKHSHYAYENATFYFDINLKEKDIILKHMFPLNIKPPIYMESWLVNFVDDYVTFSEYFMNHTKIYKSLLRYIEKQLNG